MIEIVDRKTTLEVTHVVKVIVTKIEPDRDDPYPMHFRKIVIITEHKILELELVGESEQAIQINGQ